MFGAVLLQKFNLTKIFVLRLFKMAANQTDYSSFDQSTGGKFEGTDKCKRCQFTEECVMCREKQPLVKKCLGAKLRFATKNLSEKESQ